MRGFSVWAIDGDEKVTFPNLPVSKLPESFRQKLREYRAERKRLRAERFRSNPARRPSVRARAHERSIVRGYSGTPRGSRPAEVFPWNFRRSASLHVLQAS
jgi:hypothetical protein